MKSLVAILAFLFFSPVASFAMEANPKADGYKGIWFELGQKGEYGDKYSGGLGTYTAKHRPLAIYSTEANKTFFTYGGERNRDRHLLIMASYFDHETGKVPRPTIVHDKQGVTDPHDNASICIAGDGHIWIFISGRGRHRPGFKYRSRERYSIESFEQITEEEITYPQPCFVPGKGFLHLFTKYTAGRELYWNTSKGGRDWTPDQKLAGMGGHYQNSEPFEDRKVGTAFNMHPGGNVDKRTNLYYVETPDFGATWQTASGETIETPMVDKQCPAMVRDFQSEGRLVYMKDLRYDSEGNPIILIVTSSHHMPGPKGDPRTWMTAHWKDGGWRFHEITDSTHNYDMGQLWLDDEGTWRVFGPTEPGPQPWGTGGEIALWESNDEGENWKRVRTLTHNSPLNHAYVRRPVNAHPDFCAFWADGNPYVHSDSHLYFTNASGETVWRLPYEMEEEFAEPEVVGR